MNFCELPDYKDQKVLLTCLYSGYEEYWSLSALDSTKCNSRLNVELDFLDDYGQIPMRFRRIIRKVHKLYPIKALEVKVIGVFEVDPDRRFGHLGTNTSRFLVSEILDMTLVSKQK